MLFSCHYRLFEHCDVPVTRHTQKHFRRCWHALNCFSPFINVVYSFSYAAFRKYMKSNTFWIRLPLLLFYCCCRLCVLSTPKLKMKSTFS